MVGWGRVKVAVEEKRSEAKVEKGALNVPQSRRETEKQQPAARRAALI